MQHIIRGGLFRLSFTVFNFMVGLFIAAIAGPQLFGIISLMIINAAVFQIITGLGTDAAIIWHGSSKSIDKNKVFSFSIFTILIQLILFLLAGILVLNTTGKLLLSRQENLDFFLAELLFFSGLVLTEKYSSLFYSRQQQHICNKVLSLVSFVFLIFFALVYFLKIIKNFNPLWFFCIMIFCQSLALIIRFHLYEKTKISFLTKAEFKSFLNFSILVFITNSIQFLAYRADYWFIDYYKQIEDVGIYAQAVRLAQLLWILPNIAAALLLPVLASPQEWINEKKLILLLKFGNIFNIILIIGLLIISLFFYNYFITDYSTGFRSLIIMLPGYYFFSITILLAAYFSAKRKLIINFYGSLLCFVFIIVCDLILIPLLSIEGAAISNTISYTLTTVFNIFMFQRLTGIAIKNLFFIEKGDWAEFKKFINGFEKTN